MDVDDAGWRRLALYLLITLASVFAPGAVIVACVALWRVTEDSQLLSTIRLGTADDAGALRYLWIAAAISLSYLIGYFTRAIGFLVVRLIGRRYGRNRTVEMFRLDVTTRLGGDSWNAALAAHPILGASLAGSFDSEKLTDGKLFDAFIYCKLWLRRRSPALNIDAIELEINVLCGSLTPVVVLTMLIGHQAGLSPAAWASLILANVLILAIIVFNALKLAYDERYEAFRNVIADTMMNVAAPASTSAPRGADPSPNP